MCAKFIKHFQKVFKILENLIIKVTNCVFAYFIEVFFLIIWVILLIFINFIWWFILRFFPFFFQYKNISWNEVSSVQLRKYSAIREFGGWGLRWGLFGRGTAYIVCGDRGLQLVFKNGKKLLIGTQKEEALRRALEHYYPNKLAEIWDNSITLSQFSFCNNAITTVNILSPDVKI